MTVMCGVVVCVCGGGGGGSSYGVVSPIGRGCKLMHIVGAKLRDECVIRLRIHRV